MTEKKRLDVALFERGFANGVPNMEIISQR